MFGNNFVYVSVQQIPDTLNGQAVSQTVSLFFFFLLEKKSGEKEDMKRFLNSLDLG